MAQAATAQESTTALEEVVVTGIRTSLESATALKRESSGVVDAITAEDIGKFPDTNLAESLQRVTGLSIDRSNNEGNQVTVRGFGPSFNLVTLNGRQMPNTSALQSDGISRSFNFRELASESVSAVEVYKTGRADVPSGGIGATINIRTPRPFDYDGFTTAFSIQGNSDSSVRTGDDVTPELSGLISHTFADGRFGVLLSGSDSERDSHKDRLGTQQGWQRNYGVADTSAIDTSRNPTRTYWTPFTIDLDDWNYHRTRQNGQAVLQFAPFDGLTATVDYNVSRIKEDIDMNRQSYWFDRPSGRTDANGTMVEIANPNDELNFWAWNYLFETHNDSIGLNLEWRATDTLILSLDAHQSTSHSQPDGQTSETIANLKNPAGSVRLIGANFDGRLPEVIVDDSTLPGGAYNSDNIVADLFQKRGYEMENEIRQVQLQAQWNNTDGGALERVVFGVETTKYQIDTHLTQTFAFVDPDFAGVDLDLSGLGLSFIPGGYGGGSFPFIPQYDAERFLDIVRDAGLFYLNPPTVNGVEEDTMAGYIATDFATTFNQRPVKVNVGVRLEDTDVTSYSVQNSIANLNYRQAAELQVVYDDVPKRQELEGGYTSVLPNADFSIEATDDLVARFSYSRTLSRPSIGGLIPSLSINARPNGPFIGSQGNPALLPLESDNFDLSLEWYYAKGSYASVGYFRKYVENFIGSTVVRQTIDDVNGNPLTNPSINPRPGCPDGSATPNPACLNQPGDPAITFDISTYANLKTAEVDGWELNLQHMFGNSGFGGIINATLVNSNVGFNRYSFEQSLALTGLADSANAVLFYENSRFQIRAAYNWRDDFLLSLGTEPVFTAEYGQVDLSASYQVTPWMSVFANALNLTEEATHRYGRFENQLVDYEEYGRRYAFGVRMKF
ncbi:TonB-dependent receptor [Steroidobacter agaridevorans]|uniref:TonB-dependent receptor n=2 Tax=Steroidobacterales TaxID=3060226 RepID=A0A829Y7J9_9GAMM|nr:TonB-dependent receptor [Steroidobacter agaridevorans]GFE87258.1 TonB-dependent receptor [Steroidobacter agaridevorans]